MVMGGKLSQVFTDSDGTKYAWNYKANSSSPTSPTRTLIRTIYLCPCPTNTSLLFLIVKSKGSPPLVQPHVLKWELMPKSTWLFQPNIYAAHSKFLIQAWYYVSQWNHIIAILFIFWDDMVAIKFLTVFSKQKQKNRATNRLYGIYIKYSHRKILQLLILMLVYICWLLQLFLRTYINLKESLKVCNS